MIHYLAQNGKTDVVKFILENFSDIDVLIQNQFGRSVLTEAFQSKTVETIELVLSHSSATEEKLMPPSHSHSTHTSTTDPKKSTNFSNEDNMDTEGDEDSESAVFHSMLFPPSATHSKTTAAINNGNGTVHHGNILRIRELPIIRADNPFGTDLAPEDDTTGE